MFKRIKEALPAACKRGPVGLAGTATVGTAATIATAAGMVAMPRTTLGIAAIGAGLLAYSNREALRDWSSVKFESKSDDKSVTVTAKVVDEKPAEAAAPAAA